MKTWVRKSLNVGVLSAGFLLVAGSAAQASDGGSDNVGLLNGNDINTAVQIPIDVCGNAIAVLGGADAHCAGGAMVHGIDPESGWSRSDDNVGILNGNDINTILALPIELSGNAVGLLGSAHAESHGHAMTESAYVPAHRTEATGAGDWDVDHNVGILNDNHINTVVLVPIDVCGNAIAVLGGAVAQCDGGASTEAAFGDHHGGGSNLGLGNGNDINTVIAVPIDVCGNALGVLGPASGHCDGGAPLGMGSGGHHHHPGLGSGGHHHHHPGMGSGGDNCGDTNTGGGSGSGSGSGNGGDTGYTPPSGGGSGYTPPSGGGSGYTPPSGGGSGYTPPSGGGSGYTAPSGGGNGGDTGYTAPSGGGNGGDTGYTAPSGGGNGGDTGYTAPSGGGNGGDTGYTAPSGGGNGGDTAPSGGDTGYTPPSSGGGSGYASIVSDATKLAGTTEADHLFTRHGHGGGGGHNIGILNANSINTAIEIPVDISGNAISILGLAVAHSGGGAHTG